MPFGIAATPQYFPDVANGLPVHAVHVSRTDEDGKIQQERFWGTVKQIGDPSQVYVRIDIDELQPMFQGLHYGQETTEELSRRKRRRTAAEKREKAREEQLERLRWDQAAQQRDDTNWEQAWIDLWRQKLEERERAVAAREKVRQCPSVSWSTDVSNAARSVESGDGLAAYAKTAGRKSIRMKRVGGMRRRREEDVNRQAE